MQPISHDAGARLGKGEVNMFTPAKPSPNP